MTDEKHDVAEQAGERAETTPPGASPSASPGAGPSTPTSAGPSTSPAPGAQRRTRLFNVLGALKGFGTLFAVLVAFFVGLWLASGDSAKEPANAAASTKNDTIWTCSMHPQIRLPEPGPCPICGMDLIPLDQGDRGEHSDRRVTLSKEAQKLAELRTTPVIRGTSGSELRLLGRLAYDETAVRTVTAWIGGRLDRLYVSNVGASIGAGQPIAEIYSPEVYAAHQDLIVAKKQVTQMQGGLPIAQRAAEAALNSARQRLKLLGIKQDALETMEQASAPTERVKIYSPFSGTVLEQLVNQGAYVTTGSPLFRVAALGRIWVQLDAYETDLSRIHVKDLVTIEVASLPGEQFEGKVTFIDPILNPASRTARVRIEVPNKKGRLSPGMFAEAVIHNEPDQEPQAPQAPLLIPHSAVLFTGERSVVYVEVPGQDKPTYEAREVRLGPRTGNVYPVVAGLEEGERVVTSGAFALDAELQIQGGNSMMTMMDDLARQQFRPFEIPHAELTKLEPLIAKALVLHTALSKDNLGAAKLAFGELAGLTPKLELRLASEAQARWKQLKHGLTAAVKNGSAAKDLSEARKHFETLNLQLIELLRRFGNPSSSDVRLAYCPMAFQGKGAEWLQAAEGVENPYFGKQMFGCGEIRGSAASHGRLPAPEQPAAKGAEAGGHQH